MQRYYQIRIKASFQLTKTKTNKQAKTIEDKTNIEGVEMGSKLYSIVGRSLIAS